MPKSTIVHVANQDYTVVMLPMRANAKWREQLAGPFSELASVLQGAGQIELTNGTDLANLVRSTAGTMLNSVDTLLGLLFAYSPELEQDRERIESEGYDDEALRAFTEVLKLAYPFGELMSLIRGGEADFAELALSQWGYWDASCGPISQYADMLSDAWARRKQLEAKILANEIWTMLADAMGKGESGDGERQDADSFLSEMGLSL